MDKMVHKLMEKNNFIKRLSIHTKVYITKKGAVSNQQTNLQADFHIIRLNYYSKLLKIYSLL